MGSFSGQATVRILVLLVVGLLSLSSVLALPAPKAKAVGASCPASVLKASKPHAQARSSPSGTFGDAVDVSASRAGKRMNTVPATLPMQVFNALDLGYSRQQMFLHRATQADRQQFGLKIYDDSPLPRDVAVYWNGWVEDNKSPQLQQMLTWLGSMLQMIVLDGRRSPFKPYLGRTMAAIHE